MNRLPNAGTSPFDDAASPPRVSHRAGTSRSTFCTFRRCARLRELGFTKLAMVSESALIWTLQAANPGGADRKRTSFNDPWSPIIDGWPTLLETNDILITEIP